MQQDQVRSIIYNLQQNIRRVIVGKDEPIELALIALSFPAYFSGRAWPMLTVLTLLACQRADEAKYPFLIGAKYEAKVNPKDSTQIERLTLKHMDGKKFDMKKSYKVVTSSYVMSISKFNYKKKKEVLDVKCNALMVRYIRRVRNISQPKICNVLVR